MRRAGSDPRSYPARVSKPSAEEGRASRARAWHHASQAAVCDSIEPWTHGTVVRCSRCPNYHAFNVVRVERDPSMSAEALATFADEALAGLEHRRVDVESIDAAETLRAGFDAGGWRSVRLLWMRHEARSPAAPDARVQEVPYDAVHALRVAWQLEEWHDEGLEYLAQAREVSLGLGGTVFAMHEDGVPVGYAQLERLDGSAEVSHVYVHGEHRGRGRGTALTRAAIEAGSDADDLWICADDEDRPKDLYARLGFRPAWTLMDFTRWPVR
jgi:GNAT superfamily N-acetyltransferase